MTHAEFARELLRGYVEWRTEDVCRGGGGRYTPDGWNAQIRGDQVYVWRDEEDRHHPPFRANAKAIHREIVAEARGGAKQLSLF